MAFFFFQRCLSLLHCSNIIFGSCSLTNPNGVVVIMIRFKQQYRINNPRNIVSILYLHSMIHVLLFIHLILLLDSTHYKIFFNNMIVFLLSLIFRFFKGVKK
ncbi:hypothetical protein MTR67_012873 [Solanum verrucosum]|uniref:Uncharacterized protein n=1 Tax=Solanum verrucosum TaxID=315347 RepID=A0AAF0QB90_SOLVR|nr:hypothetical protein MTR67_012873 [Solanum verrucosum]